VTIDAIGGAITESVQDDTDARKLSKPLVYTPEQILREEIRSLRDLTFKMIQWGVAILTACLTILFYGRRAFRDDFIAAGILQQGQQLPLEYYWIGTAFLFMVAVIFSFVTYLAQSRTAFYRRQLPKIVTSGIKEPSPQPKARYGLMFLYFLYPLFDVVVRLWIFELGLPPSIAAP
jgi:hypothetical protein